MEISELNRVMQRLRSEIDNLKKQVGLSSQHTSHPCLCPPDRPGPGPNSARPERSLPRGVTLQECDCGATRPTEEVPTFFLRSAQQLLL